MLFHLKFLEVRNWKITQRFLSKKFTFSSFSTKSSKICYNLLTKKRHTSYLKIIRRISKTFRAKCSNVLGYSNFIRFSSYLPYISLIAESSLMKTYFIENENNTDRSRELL